MSQSAHLHDERCYFFLFALGAEQVRSAAQRLELRGRNQELGGADMYVAVLKRARIQALDALLSLVDKAA